MGGLEPTHKPNIKIISMLCMSQTLGLSELNANYTTIAKLKNDISVFRQN